MSYNNTTVAQQLQTISNIVSYIAQNTTQLITIAGPLCTNPPDTGIALVAVHFCILVLMGLILLIRESIKFSKRAHEYRTTRWSYRRMLKNMKVEATEMASNKILEIGGNVLNEADIIGIAKNQLESQRGQWFVKRNGAKLTEAASEASIACTASVVSMFTLSVSMATALASLVECVDEGWRYIFRICSWAGTAAAVVLIVAAVYARIIIDFGYADRMFWNVLDDKNVKTNGFRHGDDLKFDGAKDLFLLHREERSMARAQGTQAVMSVKTNRRANQAVEYREHSIEAFKATQLYAWQIMGGNLTAVFFCYLGVINGRLSSAIGNNMETASITLTIATQWVSLLQTAQICRAAIKFRRATKLETALNTGNWTGFKKSAGDLDLDDFYSRLVR